MIPRAGRGDGFFAFLCLSLRLGHALVERLVGVRLPVGGQARVQILRCRRRLFVGRLRPNGCHPSLVPVGPRALESLSRGVDGLLCGIDGCGGRFDSGFELVDPGRFVPRLTRFRRFSRQVLGS